MSNKQQVNIYVLWLVFCVLYFPTFANSEIACEITNVTATTSSCDANGNYELTIDFDFIDAPGTQFDLWYGATSQGLYNLADLPESSPNLNIICTAVHLITSTELDL